MLVTVGSWTCSPNQITQADLTDWRNLGRDCTPASSSPASPLARGWSARWLEPVTPSDTVRVTLGASYVDLKLITEDAVYRDDAGTEHVVEWVTQQDVDVARTISALASDQAAQADPGSITTVELALDTAQSAAIAPMWSALLTGGTEALGRGSTGNDVRDATGRVPILWFQDSDDQESARQRFHLDVWVAPELADERIAAAVAAGGTVVNDSQAPSFTMVADVDGNKACVCTHLSPA